MTEGIVKGGPLGLLKRYFFLDLGSIQPISADDNPIELRIFIIQGNMGTGKTTNAKILADQTKLYYGAEKVNTVIANTLEDAIAGFDSKPVQMLVVDDPLKTKGMGYATFRTQQAYENFDQLFEIRHKAREKSENIKYIFLVICTQRLFGGLDPNFRQAASVIGIKSLTLNRADNANILQFLGEKDPDGKAAYQQLQKWDRLIYRWQKPSAKGMMVFIGRGNVIGIARFKRSMIPQGNVWDVDNRPLFRERMAKERKEDKYKAMQIAVVVMTRRMWPDAKQEDISKRLREFDGIKIDEKLSRTIIRIVDENPGACLKDILNHFEALPPKYRDVRLPIFYRTPSLKLSNAPSNELIDDKNNKEVKPMEAVP